MRRIYLNGNIYTVTQKMKEAMVEEEGRFIYVGSNEVAKSYVNEESEIIDLEGKFVTAGFNDSHMHVLNYGYTLEMADLAKATSSLEDVLTCLKDYIEEHQIPAGEWVRGRGWNHDFFEDSKRFPNRYDLDRVSLVHPIVIVRACGHVMVCNSKAIDILGLMATMPKIDGGAFDIVDGQLNGVFKENALNLVYSKIPQPSVSQIKDMLKSAFKELNRYGITSAQSDDLIVFDQYEDILQAFKELEEEKQMSVKIYEQSHFSDLNALKGFIEAGYKTGVGSAYFKIGPLKMMADGSLGARTALMSEPYHDDVSTSGIQVFTQSKMNAMVDYASSHGMQIAIHAIGDKAMDMIIEAYENTLKKHPRQDHRHGIVHCQITRKDLLEKYQQLELQAYIQSIFLDYDITIVEQRVGQLRSKESYAFKTLFDHNHASNGSDCPVELPDVLKGMQCAITRYSTHGKGPYRLEEALSVEEAIQSFTINGAYASFEENIKGSIETGKVADFVVLDQNLFDIDPSTFKDVQVLKTYIDGKCVYSR